MGVGWQVRTECLQEPVDGTGSMQRSENVLGIFVLCILRRSCEQLLSLQACLYHTDCQIPTLRFNNLIARSNALRIDGLLAAIRTQQSRLLSRTLKRPLLDIVTGIRRLGRSSSSSSSSPPPPPPSPPPPPPPPPPRHPPPPPTPPCSRFPKGFSGTRAVFPLAFWQLLYSLVPVALHPPRQASQPATANGPVLLGSIISSVQSEPWDFLRSLDGWRHLQPRRSCNRCEANEVAGRTPHSVFDHTFNHTVVSSILVPALKNR